MPEELNNIEKPKIETPEISLEFGLEYFDTSKNIETNKEVPEEKQQEKTKNVSTAQPVVVQSQLAADKLIKKQIEQILESNLRDLYINMPKQKQEEFKKKGEQISKQINILLKDVKVKVKNILNLIIEWLNIIPGINKIFLKQEAKIKTDKIWALRDKQK